MQNDTIAAAATALSESGIGIVRVSGERAISIVNEIYRSKDGIKKLKDFKSNTIHYGTIEEASEILDEVMVSVLKAPHSYTAEDTVEINCHGGILVMNRILECVIRHGARLAEPGEFTKRAFLNGRIDLSEAEAVMDIIQSKNEYALQSSIQQLKGAVSDQVRKLREEILYEIAYIESSLDDPEHISLEGYPQRLTERTDVWIQKLNRLLATADDGKLLREGIRTVIVGKPNAGKSSLLNLLVGEDRAIVTEIAGTTRDTLEEHILLNGIALQIIDTAGIRFTEDAVEKIGVEKARKYAKEADLILYVADASVSLDDSDGEILSLIRDKKTIILLNKSDLPPVVTEEILKRQKDGCRIIRTSAKQGKGLEELEQTVKEMFFHGEISFNDQVYITNERQKQALRETKEALLQVQNSLKKNLPEDFYSIDLMTAYSSLGSIIGEEVGEDLINEIFSKFCTGK